jgi:hypothetical protein
VRTGRFKAGNGLDKEKSEADWVDLRSWAKALGAQFHYRNQKTGWATLDWNDQ